MAVFLGIDTSNYTTSLALFDDEKADEKRDNLLKTIDDIREKYGYNTVKKAILLSGDDIAVNLH